MSEVIVGAVAAFLFGVVSALGGWVYSIGNRVTRLEADGGHTSRTLEDIKRGMEAMSVKLDGVIMALIPQHPK